MLVDNVQRMVSFFQVILVMFLCPGCAMFLPAHTNSNHRAEETVEIKMLSCDYIFDNYKGQFAKVFGTLDCNQLATVTVEEKEVPKGMEELGGPAAGLVTGALIDYVKAQTDAAIKLHDAQYKKKLVLGDFWTLDKDKNEYKQTYSGVEIIRKVDGQDAAKIVFGFKPLGDHKLFLVAPLTFKTNLAKAKVLSDEPWTWLAITPWFGKFVNVAGHNIDVEVKVEFLGLSYESRTKGFARGENQMLSMPKVGELSLSIQGYNLSSTPELSFGNPSAVGWLAGAPIPDVSCPKNDKSKCKLAEKAGAFIVDVVVTEHDTSNGRHYMQLGSEYLEKQRPEIIERVRRFVE